jgi:hypothetical protein
VGVVTVRAARFEDWFMAGRITGGDCNVFTRLPLNEQLAINVCISCLEMARRDEPWQVFGFGGRRFWNRLRAFRPAWKIALEARIFQEMLAAFTAVHAVAGQITADDNALVVRIYTSWIETFASLGFSSYETAVVRLKESITQYQQTPLDHWPELIARRIDARAVPNKRLSVRLLAGCDRFAEIAAKMILLLPQGPAPNGLGDGTTGQRAEKEESVPRETRSRSKRDALLRAKQRATDLLPAANALAITALGSIQKAFPSSRTLDGKAWDCCATIAGIYAALWWLQRKYDIESEAVLTGKVADSMVKWDERTLGAIQNCDGFVKNALDSDASTDQAFEANLGNSLGMWLLWNVYGRAPSFEESRMGAVAGRMAVESFRDWWN